MGKTPKRAFPGGDESNLYRKLKATTATSRASESILPERQYEFENLNRPRLSGIRKRISPILEKNFKELRIKARLRQITKQSKLPVLRNLESQATNMQPESEEAEVKLNVSIQKENLKEENNVNKTIDIEESAINKESSENNVPEQISNTHQITIGNVDMIFVENKISQEKGNVSLEDVSNQTKEVEEQEESDIKLTFEAEQIPMKENEAKLDDKRPKKDDKEDELLVQHELKNSVNEKGEIQNEVQTDAESYSVDIVESTTSEISETSESVSPNDIQKDKEKVDDTINNDAQSFISYDSSIMLKDVQIRLNDCLKDNSKLFDASNTEDTPNLLLKDMSFGKMLRSMSGRRSLHRMHNFQEKRISPNNSLFVNTSTSSIPQDEGASKILHYSEHFSINGSPLDRKRKIDTTTWGSIKKQKTETTEARNSLLNTSLNLFKGLRNIQVSIPNTTPYKFESSKLDSGIKDDDNKLTTEPSENAKGWCLIM